MEVADKIQQRLKEFEEFSKLAPTPVEVNAGGKTYSITPPSLWTINTVEKKFAEISVKRLETAQILSESKESANFEEVISLFSKHISIAAEIVQVILDGKPRQKHVVSVEELMNEWTVLDLVKVFKAYEYLVDVTDFFQTFRIPTVKP